MACSSARTLALYTLTHFAVDFCCFAMLWGNFAPGLDKLETVAAGFLLYNVLAFGLQPLAGAYWDAHRLLNPALAGTLTLVVGLALWHWRWLCLVLCAVGNALFHMGGGSDSLTRAGGKFARSGVFVSSGALGVALGTLAGDVYIFHGRALCALAVLCAGAIWQRGGLWRCPQRAEGFSGLSLSRRTAFTVLALCFVSVIVRAYVGFLVPIPWKTGKLLILLPALCACVGKASGGFLADLLGARRLGVGSLLCSLPMLVLFSDNIPLCTLGLLFFHLSMPVTLGGLAGLLPDSPGLAFGLTTLALLVGTVPTFFTAVPAPVWRPLAAALIALSAACLWFAFSDKRGISSEAPTALDK